MLTDPRRHSCRDALPVMCLVSTYDGFGLYNLLEMIVQHPFQLSMGLYAFVTRIRVETTQIGT